MFNMFVWFYHIFLISDLNTCLILMYDHANRSLGPPRQEYERILPLGAHKVPKYGQNVSENCQRRHILVEQVISFEMSSLTSKSVKN